jgi:hypothetical protein
MFPGPPKDVSGCGNRSKRFRWRIAITAYAAGHDSDARPVAPKKRRGDMAETKSTVPQNEAWSEEAHSGVSKAPDLHGHSVPELAEEVRFLNAHPALVPLPVTKRERRELWKRHSILSGEAMRERELVHYLRRAAVSETDPVLSIDVRRRALWDYYAPAYDPDIPYEKAVTLIEAAILTARSAHDELLSEYITERDGRNLQMISDVATEKCPVHLIELVSRADARSITNPQDVLQRRIAFEGRRQLRLAQLEFQAALNGCAEDRLQNYIADLRAFLEKDFFSGHSTRFLIEADLDSHHRYRVKGGVRCRRPDEPESECPKGMTRFKMNLDVRLLKGGTPVFFDSRIKKHQSLKRVRKSEPRHHQLDDLCGVKFVFFNERDLLAGVDRIRQTLARYPGCVFGEASNFTHAGILDPANVHSSDEYRAMKFNILLFGRYYEVQVMFIEDWINEQASHGSENHKLYKLRKYMDTLFPRMWPQVIYGVDWKDPALRRRLLKMFFAKIGS